jgi:hypothetical protein
MRPTRRDSTRSAPAVASRVPESAPRTAAPSDSDVAALIEARESPTAPPPFDLETFARERAGDPEDRVAPSDRPTEPAPEELESNTRLRAGQPISEDRTAQRRTQEIRTELADKFFDGQYDSALVLAEELIVRRSDDASALDYAAECRRMLEKEYIGRIGGQLGGVPTVVLSLHDLSQRKLDHRAGFLLSRMDGESSLEALLDLGTMPRLEALRIIAELVDHGIVRLG